MFGRPSDFLFGVFRCGFRSSFFEGNAEWQKTCFLFSIHSFNGDLIYILSVVSCQNLSQHYISLSEFLSQTFPSLSPFLSPFLYHCLLLTIYALVVNIQDKFVLTFNQQRVFLLLRSCLLMFSWMIVNVAEWKRSNALTHSGNGD